MRSTVRNGAQLDLSNVATYTGPDTFSPTFLADGQNSHVDLSGLISLVGGRQQVTFAGNGHSFVVNYDPTDVKLSVQ
jgi:hypothetical protein